MALGTLQGLRPAAMRQLYMSTVASKLDYAAPIWFQAKQSLRMHKTFEAVQKVGSQTILGAYRTAAGTILETEAGLLPTSLRLERRVMQYVINLHTLPKQHPWWMLKKRIHKRIKRFKSPLGYHLEGCKEVINDTKPVETIQAFVQPPSARTNCLRFAIYQD
jgi:hypothetical protein